MFVTFKDVVLNRLSTYFLTLTCFFLLSACDNGGNSGGNVVLTPYQTQTPDVNLAPVSDAGLPQSISEQKSVILSGRGEDSDGTVVSYHWKQTSGIQVYLETPDSATLQFEAPETDQLLILTFELTVTDNNGAVATDTVILDVLPSINGLVEGNLTAANVKLFSLPEQTLISEVKTDAHGAYQFLLNSIPDAYLIEVSGGTFFDGEPFSAVFSAVCLKAERTSCHASPTSTLIKHHAERSNQLENTIKASWLTEIAERLGSDLTLDPFVDGDAFIQAQPGQVINVSTIRDHLQRGIHLDNWITEVLDFVQTGTQNAAILSWFSGASFSSTASAGGNQNVAEQSLVHLTGEGNNLNDHGLNYQWTQVAGQSVVITNASAANASFESPVTTNPLLLSFLLTVTDSRDAAVTDSVDITVNPVNSAPTVNAGTNRSVNEQSSVTLAGGGTDSDGNIISYNWAQTSGTSVVLSSASTASTSFTSPTLITPETLTFQLMVTDNEASTTSDAVSITVNPVNISPIVNAGTNQSVNEQSAVVVSGSGADNDGSIVSYSWTQISGTGIALSSASTASASFISPTLFAPETLTFQLTVTDNEASATSDAVNVTVNPVNSAPIANAGTNQSVNEQSAVTLSGGGTDSDGSIVSYSWTQTSGTGVVLSGASTASASFTSPTLIAPETLIFQLTVTDNESSATSDTVSITVNPVNTAPTANAGTNLLVNEQSAVTLSGSGTDSDGSIVSYSWAQTSGTGVALSGANTASASFTSPTLVASETLNFQLTVTDNEASATSDTVSVTVNPVNTAPTANAGTNQSVNEQSAVTLSGSGADSDGSIASYSWTQTSGTGVALSNANTASASFTSPTLLASETLIFQLTVTDNEASATSDTVSVTVNPVNTAPTANAGTNQSVNEQSAVTLSGSGADSDGSIASYSWTQTSGTSVGLSGANTASASFTSPTLIAPETLTFQLTVTDNEASATSDTVSVTVNPVNTAPTANAGSDNSVVELTQAFLSAAASSDSDGSIVSYAWVQTAGQPVSLTNANTQTASFSADVTTGTQLNFTFELTVTDNEGATNTDSINITVTRLAFAAALAQVTDVNLNVCIVAQSLTYADEVSGINCQGLSITSTAGIDNFAQVASVNLQYNQITSLTIGNNTTLTHLYLRNNQLTSLDVSGATALIHLDSYTNQLTSLDLSNNLALTSLTSGRNQLVNLDVSNNTALTALHLQENDLTSLDLSRNTALVDLRINSNRLSTLDLSNNLVLLPILSLQFNELTSVIIGNNTTLTHLYLRNNQLTSLDISGATSLTHLDLYINQLASLDVSNNLALTSLTAGRNQLASLDLTNNTALTVLHLQESQLTTLDLSLNTALSDLRLDSNRLTTLDLSNDLALLSVNLQYNELTSLSIGNNTTLTHLYLRNNLLTSLDISGATALTYLDLYINQLTSLNVSNNNALANLSAGRNQLTNIDLTNNTGLSTLYLRENQLTSIDLSSNPALTVLELNSNQLTTLSTTNNTALTELYSTGNQLVSLDVSNNTALARLELQLNQMTTIDVSANTALTTLYLANNQFVSEPAGLSNITDTSAFIDLVNNPLNAGAISNLSTLQLTYSNLTF